MNQNGGRYFRHASEIFSVPMPMMMSVSNLGLLGLMLNILMTPSFAAPLGQEEPFVLVCDLIFFEVVDQSKTRCREMV
ncbi:uncharacterized protein LOC121052985 isoform X2 [Rosa chinensis]|uniref:uncharacterized protein LOC121052985 isoform X2 n=1 Tax=Rosa chinensis TaxID=74649 RepID=UPI001AD8BCDF|nr:uncharacterized protein LOC121052985 isoform X2 [Rosa chinensis]